MYKSYTIARVSQNMVCRIRCNHVFFSLTGVTFRRRLNTWRIWGAWAASDLLSRTLGLGLAEELTCDPSPRPSPHRMERGCPSGRVRGRRQVHPVSTGQDVCWYRFLIDIGNEERVVCQNGALERPLDGPATPPYRLRAPTVSPPCPLPTGSGTLSAPFWHSWGCPRRSNAGKNEAETMGFRRKPFGLTFRRAERCLSAVSSQGSSASPSLGGDGSSAFGARHIPSLAQPERSRQLAVHL